MAIVYPLIDRGDGKFEQLQSGDTLPGALGGTVTSVGLTAPAFLSVSGSPITGSGTLALSLASQAVNTFFMGPSSGGSAAPTFRAPVLADVPASALGTGTANSTTYLRGDRTWQTISLSPAGSNTQVQYNNAGAFGASANFTYDGATLKTKAASSAQTANIFEAIRYDGAIALQVDDNTSVTLGGSFDAVNAKHANQHTFQYHPLTGYSDSGIRVSNLQTGAAFRLHTLGGGMYITTDAGVGAPLLLGVWQNPGDSSEFEASPGHWRINTGNLGVGAYAVGARLLVRSSTLAQFRPEYDASNYATLTINSAGVATWDNIGSTPKTVFSDPVEVASGGIFGPMIADNASVYIDGPGGVYFDNDFTPRVALGDWNANGNGTQLVVDDNSQQVNRNIGNGGLFAQIGGKLFHVFTDETTATTSTENLYAFTLPAGSLAADGDSIKVEYAGIFAATTNTKRVQPKFAGMNLATGQTSSSLDTDWTADLYILRKSNTAVRYSVEITSSTAVLAVESGEITGLNLTSTGYQIDLDGRSLTTAGGLTAESGTAIFHPAA